MHRQRNPGTPQAVINALVAVPFLHDPNLTPSRDNFIGRDLFLTGKPSGIISGGDHTYIIIIRAPKMRPWDIIPRPSLEEAPNFIC